MIYSEDFRFLRDVYDVLFMELRDRDKSELKDFTGASPQEALVKIMQDHSVLKLIKDEYDRTLGIYGIIPCREHSTQYKKVGEVIFLATEELFEKYKYEFLKKAPSGLRKLMDTYDYDVLFNYTQKNNQKWIEFLGFEVFMDKEVFFENPREPFYFFKIERS